MLWTDKSNMSSENLAKDLEPFQMPCGVSLSGTVFRTPVSKLLFVALKL